MVESEHLVGLTEIAKGAGVNVQAVSNWTKRHEDFPAPVLRLSCGSIWLRPQVEEWLRNRKRYRR